GATSTVPIEVLAPTRKKPYLGGFRHKITSVEFHNASSQTQQLPLRWPKNTLYCRDTQTKMLANQMIQTAQDTATQMTKIGCYVSVQGNKLRKPGKYRTADEEEAEKKTMVLVLQKYIRRYLAIKRVGKIRAAKERKLQFERDQQLKREQDKEKRIRDEFQRRQFPRSRKDFNTLFNALEKWRLQEIAKINDTLTGAERKAALYMLLNQELEHLAAIGRHQAIADDIVAEKNIQAFLNKTSDPKVFISKYDNSATLIDTPYTVRASQLREIYNSLLENHYTLDERLDALLTLKYTIRDYDCKLCYDITRLVDREADLLMRGVSNNNLAGLRKRISTLFLQFIKTPFFNPEAARYTTLPPLAKSNKVYYCASCSKFHPSHEFPLNVNAARPGACKMCISKDNEGRFRADYNNFKYMLRSLREKEERYKDNSTIAFLIQDSDIHYLVTKIWGSESIISNCTDLYDLTLVRWNKDTVWTPWNCLLVTHEEAVCHDKLEDIYEAYGEVFVNKVNHKHMMAKSHFGRLPWLETKVLNPNEDKYYPSKKGSKYEPKQTSCHIFPTG
ncbi:IQ and ubiquitin-like domain-containing protein, partial [Argonauta hians]